MVIRNVYQRIKVRSLFIKINFLQFAGCFSSRVREKKMCKYLAKSLT